MAGPLGQGSRCFPYLQGADCALDRRPKGFHIVPRRGSPAARAALQDPPTGRKDLFTGPVLLPNRRWTWTFPGSESEGDWEPSERRGGERRSMTSVPGTERFSVAVVTRGRADKVRKLLQSLGSTVGSGGLERVVLVDDSPDPLDLGPLKDELPLSYFHSGERLHISRAKNRALREIRTPWVFYIDDDNVVLPGTLEGALRVVSQAPWNLAALQLSAVYRDRPDLVWVYATPFREDHWGFELVGRNRSRDPRWEGRLLPTDALPNASLLRTQALREVGGFDEALPVNSSADLCRRLKRAGWAVLAHTGSILLHDVPPPGVPGYWAAHSNDPDRTFHEVRDWFVFQRRVHAGERIVSGRALWHSFPFLLAIPLGLLLLRKPGMISVLAAMTRGTRDGITCGLEPRPAPEIGRGGSRLDPQIPSG